MMRLFIILVFLSSSAFAANVQEVKTPGGFTAWLVEDHALPILSVHVAFTGSGYAYDAPSKDGRANLAAAMLTEGAGDLDWRAFNDALESRAIAFNVSAEEDVFNASFECLTEHEEAAFSDLGLVLTKPRFDNDALERTKRQTLSLIAQEDQDPGYKLYRGWQKLAFGDHPYGKPQMGLPETVNALSADDLRNFTANYLTKENIVIAASGDITPKQLAEFLDAKLGALPAHYAPDVKVPDVVLPAQAQQIVIPFDIPQTMVTFGSQGIKRADPDYYAAYVMNEILGGNGLTSRLGADIRETKGLAYSIFSMLEPLDHAAVWKGHFATRSAQAENALVALRANLKEFSEKGPTDKEMADTKHYLTGSFVAHLDSNASISHFLIRMQLDGLGRDYIDRRNGIINAVTKQDVARMAKKLTDPEHLLVVVVGKPLEKNP